MNEQYSAVSRVIFYETQRTKDKDDMSLKDKEWMEENIQLGDER